MTLVHWRVGALVLHGLRGAGWLQAFWLGQPPSDLTRRLRSLDRAWCGLALVAGLLGRLPEVPAPGVRVLPGVRSLAAWCRGEGSPGALALAWLLWPLVALCLAVGVHHVVVQELPALLEQRAARRPGASDAPS